MRIKQREHRQRERDGSLKPITAAIASSARTETDCPTPEPHADSTLEATSEPQVETCPESLAQPARRNRRREARQVAKQHRFSSTEPTDQPVERSRRQRQLDGKPHRSRLRKSKQRPPEWQIATGADCTPVRRRATALAKRNNSTDNSAGTISRWNSVPADCEWIVSSNRSSLEGQATDATPGWLRNSCS